jgi:hypothetical protein
MAEDFDACLLRCSARSGTLIQHRQSVLHLVFAGTRLRELYRCGRAPILSSRIGYAALERLDLKDAFHATANPAGDQLHAPGYDGPVCDFNQKMDVLGCDDIIQHR